MSRAIHQRPRGEPFHAGQLIPLVLLPLLALLPPETRGESMAAAAALIAILALYAWQGTPPTSARVAFLAAAVLAVPAARAALAPGAAVRPIAVALVAVALGLAVAGLRATDRCGERFAMVLAAVGGVAALHAVYQRLWGLGRLAEAVAADPDLPDRELILARLEYKRAFAAFSTPAALGGFLALAAPVTLGLAVAARGRRRWIWGALLLVELGGLLAASSATAIAALFGAVCLAALVWRARRRSTWIALLAVLALLALSTLALRGRELIDLSHPNSPWRLRAGNFLAGASMARDHPWIGVGPGGFAAAYPAYRRPGDNETRHVHDLPLELCAELGWTGGGLLSLLFYWIFLAPLWRERSHAPPWRRGLAVGLAAFAVQNLADFTAFLPSLLWMAALLRGHLALPAEERGEGPAVGGRRPVQGATLAVAVAAALVAGACGISDNYRHACRRAAFEGDLERAESLALRAAAWAPWDPDAALLSARMTRDERPQAPAGLAGERPVLNRAERAVRLAPDWAAARVFRGKVRRVLGDLPGAFADMDTACRLYPAGRDDCSLRLVMKDAVEEAMGRAGERP